MKSTPDRRAARQGFFNFSRSKFDPEDVVAVTTFPKICYGGKSTWWFGLRLARMIVVPGGQACLGMVLGSNCPFSQGKPGVAVPDGDLGPG